MSAFSTKTSAKATNKNFGTKSTDESFFGVQAKLNIGKPHDKYEVEADRTADKIITKKQNTSQDSFFSPSPFVQKKLAKDLQKQEEINQEIQQKPLVDSISPVVQLEKEDKLQNKLDNPKKEESKTSEIFTAPKSLIQNKPEEEVQQKTEEETQAKEDEQKVQMSASGDATPSDNLESKLNNSKGGGSSLPKSTKSEMESGFGADFSKVKIHNDSNAVQMNKQLGSQAFVNGNNIYFNEGKYNPNSQTGKHLLAHELTHTVQQGASIRMKLEDIQMSALIQASFLSELIPEFIKENVRHIPGYTLLTVVAGYDPLNDRNVDRNAINLIEGIMGLVPFGTAIFDKLQEYGILDQVFDWVNGRLSELGLSMDGLLQLVQDAWDESTLTTFIEVLTSKFNTVVNRIGSFANSLIGQIITWIKEALIGVAEPLLAENRAWSLIKKIIKYDPLRDEEVSATTVEILEDFLILIDKQTELEQMREKGTLQETADWLDTQVGTFTSLLGELRGLITMAWDAIQPANLANISDNLTQLAAQAEGFLQRVWTFASAVALKVLELVKDSLLAWLSEQASGMRGYSLIKVIIGKDPFTQEVVPRTVPNLIRGFMSLMEGGEEQYAQMEQSGAIARIVGEVEAAVATLNMTPQSIGQLFTAIWDTLTIQDLINPLDAFLRIIEQFGEPIGRLIAFVAEIVRIVIMAILEIMNFPFDLIGNIITRALEAIEDIKKDPIGFLKNIIRALKQGFMQFFDNIVTHLINGVTGWLMTELRDAGIPELTDFSLQGVISWVLEVLGISMERIWEKLAAHPRIGPERVARIRGMINTLEGIWTFIRDVQERGIAAIWDKIQEQLSNLWNTVLDAVKNFVMERIVNRIMARLLSMLDPTGIMAIINGAMAFFNAIQSFIKYLREMLEVVNSFVNGVADIARGNVATAADYLERTMGQAMPVVIGFLANQVGLSGIGSRIAEIIGAVREMVDQALTWLVNRAVDGGMALLDRVLGRGGGIDVKQLAKNRLINLLGANTSIEEANRYSRVVFSEFQPLGLQSLHVVNDANNENEFYIEATASPTNRILALRDTLNPAQGGGQTRLAATVSVREGSNHQIGTRERNLLVTENRTYTQIEATGPRNISGQPLQVATINVGENQEEVGYVRIPRNDTLSRTSRNQTGRPTSSAIVTPENMNSRNIDFIAFNVGRRGNHAEETFVDDLENTIGISNLSDIEVIDININNSPCDRCCGVLSNLASRINLSRNGNSTRFIISWDEVYSDTTQEGIAILRNNWSIAGGVSLPSGNLEPLNVTDLTT